jgi:hypothetical protein
VRAVGAENVCDLLCSKTADWRVYVLMLGRSDGSLSWRASSYTAESRQEGSMEQYQQNVILHASELVSFASPMHHWIDHILHMVDVGKSRHGGGRRYFQTLRQLVIKFSQA